MPLVSVIVPVYNVEKYIYRCIDSILNQNYQNLELILVDDGSKDNSGKICDEYAGKDSRVLVIHKANGGVSSARNAGIEAANGEYLTFVDGDDYIFSDCLSTLVTEAEKASADIVCHNYTVSPNNHESGNCSHLLSADELSKMVSQGQHISNSCVLKLYRKEFIIRNSIQFTSRITMAEDSLFCVDCFNASPVTVQLDYTGYVYDKGRSDNATSRYYPQIADECRIIANEFINRLGYNVSSGVIYHHIYNIIAEVANLYLCSSSCTLPSKARVNVLADIAESEPFKTAIAESDIFFNKDRIMLFLLKHHLYSVYLKIKSRNNK